MVTDRRAETLEERELRSALFCLGGVSESYLDGDAARGELGMSGAGETALAAAWQRKDTYCSRSYASLILMVLEFFDSPLLRRFKRLAWLLGQNWTGKGWPVGRG